MQRKIWHVFFFSGIVVLHCRPPSLTSGLTGERFLGNLRSTETSWPNITQDVSYRAGLVSHRPFCSSWGVWGVTLERNMHTLSLRVAFPCLAAAASVHLLAYSSPAPEQRLLIFNPAPYNQV